MTRISTLGLVILVCLAAIPSIAQARYRDGMNLYAYVGNRPLVSTDPMGEDAALVVPGGHVEVAVEVHGCDGKVIGVLSASYGGQEWRSGAQGIWGKFKALLGQPGNVILGFQEDAKLKGTRIVEGTTEQDNALVDWIMKQIGKD